jgi:hypothetical protein
MPGGLAIAGRCRWLCALGDKYIAIEILEDGLYRGNAGEPDGQEAPCENGDNP